MELVLDVILCLYFNSSNFISIIIISLFIIAAALMLKKSGSKWWIALIPWYREYELARCANCESDGRVYAFLMFINAVVMALGNIFRHVLSAEDYSSITPIFVVVDAVLVIPFFVYNWRIFEGYRELYDASKWWRIVYVAVSPRFIVMFYWALNKNWKS